MILGRLRDALRSLASRRRLQRQIQPRVFLDMADELRSLALCAAQACPGEASVQAVIRDIHQEAEKLVRIAGEPTFLRMSAQERLQLRQGLLHSKRQLLESIQSAPSPTRLLQ
ncbi:MAG: hypothetical protein AB7E32_12685 [Desulfovibrio sp.]